MSSVMVSLILSILAVAKAMISHTHDNIVQGNFNILSEDICNCKTLTNEWCVIECESIMADKGLIYMMKSIGRRTEPRGIPEITGVETEK